MLLEEKVIDIKVAMLQNKPKEEILTKYLEYLNEYDKETRNVIDKAEKREVFFRYLEYMEKK